MAKEMLGAKVSEETMNRLEEFAESKGISKSEATGRLLRQGLDVVEKNVRVVPLEADGGLEGEIQDTQRQVEKTQNQVEEVSENVTSISEQLNEIMLPLTVAILWIGIEVTVGIPFAPIGTAITGIPLVLWLIYPQVRDML
jgi:hypothetical protein